LDWVSYGIDTTVTIKYENEMLVGELEDRLLLHLQNTCDPEKILGVFLRRKRRGEKERRKERRVGRKEDEKMKRKVKRRREELFLHFSHAKCTKTHATQHNTQHNKQDS